MQPRAVRLVLPILAAGLSFAQTAAHPASDAAGAKALLESAQLLEKAWGAYSAAQLHDGALSEPIVAQLRRAESLRDSPDNSEAYACIQSLLDSLIQLHAQVPLEAILPYLDRWRSEALILLAAKPPDAADESALLKLREQDLNDAEWLAVNNLLLRLRSTALLVKTLQETQITHTFEVGESRPNGIGGDFARGMRRLVRFPTGFPSIGIYQLEIYRFGTSRPAPDDVLVVRGPEFGGYHRGPGKDRADVLCRRTAVPANGAIGEPSYNFRNTDRQVYRRAYLAELGGISVEQSDLLFCPTTTIPWHSNADFLARTREAVTSQGNAIVGFAARAGERTGLAALTGLHLTIDPIVKDWRKEVKAPLPALGAKEIVLK